MYIEMVDETGQVSDEILKQTQEILEFAAQKIGKEDKEMAVTFVTNERSHELNLEYRNTDRPTDVISLEYKPEVEISFDEEDLADNPELAEMMAEFDTYIGELFISIDNARNTEFAAPCPCFNIVDSIRQEVHSDIFCIDWVFHRMTMEFPIRIKLKFYLMYTCSN